MKLQAPPNERSLRRKNAQKGLYSDNKKWYRVSAVPRVSDGSEATSGGTSGGKLPGVLEGAGGVEFVIRI